MSYIYLNNLGAERGRIAVVSLAVAFISFAVPHAYADGPDVMLGVLGAPELLEDGDIAYLGASTTSCNAGNMPLDWKSKPDNRHPVISLNLYQLFDGTMKQIGQSWLKHGLFALEHNACGFGCNATNQGDSLGPGCSDPYGAAMNSGPNLGSRSEVNPVTGIFDGATSNDHSTHTHTHQLEHSLQIKTSDLDANGAEYLIEGHYVTADDAAAGNSHNNVSYRKIKLATDFNGQRIFVEAGDTVWYQPAISAWPNGDLQSIESIEANSNGKELTSKISIATKVRRTQSGKYRYDYAVYNMNSERGIASVSLPLGNAQISNVGFYGVKSYGESWSNQDWSNAIDDGQITWSTVAFDQDPDSNAIRWGTTYNFWFESDTAPVAATMELVKFKPGVGPDKLTVQTQVPAGN